MTDTPHVNFILDFQQHNYPYLEEINEGILKHVEITYDNSAILDVGAGRGSLGEALKKKGYKVYAIESNEAAADEASQKVDHVITLDLHDIKGMRLILGEQKFKYIIFSDVLEHVYDPLDVIKNYRSFLTEDGLILISLPNAVNWLNRIRFMLGHFNYEMTGVMDRTHIRFFTFYSAKKLVQASQCVILKMDCTPFITRAFLPMIKRWFNRKKDVSINSIITSPYYRFYEKFIYPIEYRITRMLPSLFAFRMIIVARVE